MIDSRACHVKPSSSVKLAALPTRVDDLYRDEKEYRALLAAGTEQLQRRQNLLYADDHQSLLVIFQAMDAAGKDGAIKHVMSGVNPQGCQVFSFKAPSPEELDHDFLWRAARALPERGRIGIFNRSYYEETLIVRVHPGILERQHLPPTVPRGEKLWEERFESINHFEEHLHRNGTTIVKIFLHLSREKQRDRFLKRLDDPAKNWKFSAADLTEREFWDDYQHAYAEMLSATSTKHAPWLVIPADDKQGARLLVSDAIVRALEGMDLKYPTSQATPETLKELRRRLTAEQ